MPKWKATYDERGNQTSVSYFGTDGKPCLNKDGYAGWKATFDERGNQTSKSYFGTDGKPCLNKDGNAGWKATYDERGNQTSQSYFGTDGKPCLKDGICRMEGHLRRAGKPDKRVLLRHRWQALPEHNGIAGWKATFDERGNQTSMSYFGMKGEPIIAPKLGYHRAVTKYDPNGKVLEEKYFDCQDKPLTYAEALRAVAKNMPAEGAGPPKRVTVTQVFPGGEAAAKGVHEGDIIVRYAGHPITSHRAFVLEVTKGGTEPRELVLLRDGKEITLRVAPGPLKVRLEETPVEASRESKPAASEKTAEKASTPAAKTVPPKK